MQDFASLIAFCLVAVKCLHAGVLIFVVVKDLAMVDVVFEVVKNVVTSTKFVLKDFDFVSRFAMLYCVCELCISG